MKFSQSGITIKPRAVRGTSRKLPNVRRRSGRRLGVVLALLALALGGAWWGRSWYLVAHPLAPNAPEVSTLSPQVRALGRKRLALQAKLDKSPRDLMSRWQLADTYQKLGQVTLAAQELKTINAQKPNVEAGVGLGNIALRAGDIVGAETQFRRVTQAFPRDPQVGEAWRGLSATLYHQGRFMEAAEAAHKAMHSPTANVNDAYLRAVAGIELAMQHPTPRVHEMTLKYAKIDLLRVLEVWGDNGDVYYRMGRACAALDQQKQAIKYLRRAVELLPHRIDPSMQLAQALNKTGERDEALQLAEKTLAAHPDNPEVNDFVGQLLQFSDRPDAPQKMFDCFARAVRARPDNARIHQNFGAACMRLGKFKEAQREFETVVRLDPNRSYAFQQLARLYTRQGDKAKGARFAAIATGLASNDQQQQYLESLASMDESNVPLHLILADRYRDLKRNSLARAEYLIVLHGDPDNAHAKRELAKIPVRESRNLTPDAGAFEVASSMPLSGSAAPNAAASP